MEKYAGIDIAKRTHWMCVTDGEGRFLMEPRPYDNDAEGLSRMVADLDLCGGDVSKLTAKMVFDAAKELDDVAMKVFNHYVDYLCKAIYTIIAFLDPEMIVLGGGISKSGDFLLNAVRERIPRYLLFKTLPYSRVEIARLGADAGMIGAAMLGRHA